MRPRLSLFSRILSWFLHSIGVLVLLVVGVFNLQFRLGPLSPLRAVSAEGLDSVARLIEQDLDAGGRSQWDAILTRRSAAYGVQFVLVSEDGSYLAGRRMDVPRALLAGMGARGPSPGGAVHLRVRRPSADRLPDRRWSEAETRRATGAPSPSLSEKVLGSRPRAPGSSPCRTGGTGTASSSTPGRGSSRGRRF